MIRLLLNKLIHVQWNNIWVSNIIDIILMQESWIKNNKITRIDFKGCKICYHNCKNPRSSKICFPLWFFCFRDPVAVKIYTRGKNWISAPSYLLGEERIPTNYLDVMVRSLWEKQHNGHYRSRRKGTS